MILCDVKVWNHCIAPAWLMKGNACLGVPDSCRSPAVRDFISKPKTSGASGEIALATTSRCASMVRSALVPPGAGPAPSSRSSATRVEPSSPSRPSTTSAAGEKNFPSSSRQAISYDTCVRVCSSRGSSTMQYPLVMMLSTMVMPNSCGSPPARMPSMAGAGRSYCIVTSLGPLPLAGHGGMLKLTAGPQGQLQKRLSASVLRRVLWRTPPPQGLEPTWLEPRLEPYGLSQMA
mmetsp:Transcript_23581/g.74727  ORF Transcript_23581/g.74727 Transcript_23581/m.74727 type:complete len:233 (-) Transcript_23581:12-710(-)